ncbi:syntaxin-5-like [Schistocerca gregaria]|uniref:syntaxin-5-like n=1 Tax=Schistocerca gregaria TaxID=7010 RepID=UPI00211E7C12|nr:syntaxin-5-like [Schistocerca gregaria]
MMYDRTTEFINVAQSLHQNTTIPSTRVRKDTLPSVIKDINHTAKKISGRINVTAQWLKDLAKLTKVKSIFQDPAEKIEELVNTIKASIQSIRIELEGLEQLIASQPMPNHQLKEHHELMATVLKTNLAEITTEFTNLLRIRTENLKAQQNRKEKFVGSRHHISSHLRHPYDVSLEEENADTYGENDDISVMIPLVPAVDSKLEKRSNAIRAIERTVEEVGQIMSQIAFITKQQDEVITRIDEDISRSEFHIQGAYSELLNYIPKITRSRWLYLKIFAIFIVFIILLFVLI